MLCHLRRTPSLQQHSVSLSNNPHWFLQSESRGLLFLVLEPWAVEACYGAGTPHSLGGISVAKLYLLIFLMPHVFEDQPIPHLHPLPTNLDVASSLYS